MKTKFSITLALATGALVMMSVPFAFAQTNRPARPAEGASAPAARGATTEPPAAAPCDGNGDRHLCPPGQESLGRLQASTPTGVPGEPECNDEACPQYMVGSARDARMTPDGERTGTVQPGQPAYREE